MALVRNRDISIDIMKCLAVILVMNSHMDLLYGKYSALATGGGRLVTFCFSLLLVIRYC